MRTVLALALALVGFGCVQQPEPTPYPPDPGPVPNPGGPDQGYGCTADSQCGTGEACARDGECLPTSDIQAVHVTWTVSGQIASPTSCANAPDLELDFTGDSAGDWGYAPVPCMEGKFSIDKLPIWYTYVQLGRVEDVTSGAGGKIDPASGTVALDLPY